MNYVYSQVKCQETIFFTTGPSVDRYGFNASIVTYWLHVPALIWINIGSGNGLLPDGTKPLPEAMLNYDQ